MDDLNGFQRDCLFAVAGLDAPNGTEVKAVLEDYYTGEVHTARLYPALDSLVEAGLVNKAQRDGRTNVYTLTEAGEETIAARRRWEDRHVDELVAAPA